MSDRTTLHPTSERPPDGSLIRYVVRFPLQGDREFTGYYADTAGGIGGVWSKDMHTKMIRWDSIRLIGWALA